MASYGQKRLNKEDVRKGTLRFIFSFLALTAISFLSVFLFFKSSQLQNKEIRKELDNYNDMIGRNNFLKIKMDTIYYKLSLLSNDKVQNDMMLRNSIIDDLMVSRQLIGKDSADDLKYYATLLKNIEPMLGYKNQLIKLKTDEKNALRSLDNCMGRIEKVTPPSQPKLKKPGRLFN